MASMAFLGLGQAVRAPSASGANVENEQHTSRQAQLVAVGRT